MCRCIPIAAFWVQLIVSSDSTLCPVIGSYLYSHPTLSWITRLISNGCYSDYQLDTGYNRDQCTYLPAHHRSSNVVQSFYCRMISSLKNKCNFSEPRRTPSSGKLWRHHMPDEGVLRNDALQLEHLHCCCVLSQLRVWMYPHIKFLFLKFFFFYSYEWICVW